MMKKLHYLFTLLLMAVAGTSFAATVTDKLTAADLAATNTTYTDFSGVTKTSDAVYAGISAKDSDGNIQIRSKNSNSGIVSTTSGGYVKSIKVNIADGTNQLDIYASNTAYTAASDLYATGTSNNQGVKIGSLTATGTIEVEGEYKYIGLRSYSGAIYISSIEINWDSEAPVVNYETESFPYEYVFKGNGKGDFKIEDVTLDGLSYVWSYDENYGMKVSAYADKAAHTTESWLISPYVELSNITGDVNLQFNHAVNKFKSIDTVKDAISLWVRTEGGEWQELDFEIPSSLSWTFASSGLISLNAFKGNKVQIGFKYTSTTENCGTWEIQDFNVIGGEIEYTDRTIKELSLSEAAETNVNLILNDALVVYYNANDGYFVREGDYAMLFYKTGLDMAVGQTLSGSVKVNYSPYNNQPEVVDIAGVTNLDNIQTGTGTVEPTKMTVDALPTATNINDLVLVEGCKLTIEEQVQTSTDGSSTTTTYLYYILVSEADETASAVTIRLYDRFKISGIFDNIDATKTYNVKGIMNRNNDKRRIYPISIVPADDTNTTAISNVSTEAADNAIYNLQGVRVEKAVKGIYIINGKKVVVK